MFRDGVSTMLSRRLQLKRLLTRYTELKRAKTGDYQSPVAELLRDEYEELTRVLA